jgi:hypothetical protein
MGFQKPNIESAYSVIRTLATETASPYNDGFTSLHCKRDLYMLKCFINDTYERLPQFAEEAEWEQERVIQKLKQK